MKTVFEKLLFALVLSAAFVLAGCNAATSPHSTPAPTPTSNQPLPQAQADTMTVTVMSAVSTALSSALSGSPTAANSAPSGAVSTLPTARAVVSYSVPGVTLAYTATATGATFSMTFSNFSNSGVTITSGNVNATETISSGGSTFTFAESGTFTILYSGTTYTFGFNMNLTSSGGSYTYAGSYTVNGSSYTYGSNTPGTNPTPTTSSSNTGGISFYTNISSAIFPISITCNGVVGSLTQYFSAGAPTYGQAGTFTISNLAAGTYPFTASATGYSWSGSVTITSGQQFLEGLTLSNLAVSSSAGKIMFYSTYPIQVGTITCYVDGSAVGTLNGNVYFTGTPSWGQSGTLIVSESPGTHSLSASASGATWPPVSITLTSGEQFSFNLHS